MKVLKTVVAVGVVVGLSLVGAQTAKAAPIVGAISFSDGFDPGGIPGAPTSSIVSALTTFDLNNVVNAYTPGSASGSFVGTTSATAFDVLPPPLPTVFYTTDTGFVFTVTSLVQTASTALTCVGGLCGDSVTFSLGGFVTGPGAFVASEFLGNWTANGSCLGTGAECASNVTASWSSSVVATGQEVTVPEPASLALLGMGLLGVAAARRRRV